MKGTSSHPVKAGQIKKGHLVLLGKSEEHMHPCRVLDVSVSKTGKHGHAKCHFNAVDIFTGKKIEGLESSTHNM